MSISERLGNNALVYCPFQDHISLIIPEKELGGAARVTSQADTQDIKLRSIKSLGELVHLFA